LNFLLGVTAESLRAKRDRKSAISLQCDQFHPKFQVEGVSPIIIARIVRPINALELCRYQFSQKENVVADFLQAKCDFRRKSAVLRFEPPLGDLGTTYDDHPRLIGKRVVDFLLVLIELFSLYFAPTGAGWPKFQVEGVASHQPLFCSEN